MYFFTFMLLTYDYTHHRLLYLLIFYYIHVFFHLDSLTLMPPKSDCISFFIIVISSQFLVAKPCFKLIQEPSSFQNENPHINKKT